jgi:hypothetical protein
MVLPRKHLTLRTILIQTMRLISGFSLVSLLINPLTATPTAEDPKLSLDNNTEYKVGLLKAHYSREDEGFGCLYYSGRGCEPDGYGRFIGAACPEVSKQLDREEFGWIHTAAGALSPLWSLVDVMSASALVIPDPVGNRSYSYRRLNLFSFSGLSTHSDGAKVKDANQMFMFEPAAAGKFYIREAATQLCLKAQESPSWWSGDDKKKELFNVYLESCPGPEYDSGFRWEWVPIEEPGEIPRLQKLLGH